ncbi:uncharacterized protein LOC132798023 [Drosophila nasuta]|uniref:uncharacterized protein LOC132798023 n=1 Tax=Drosophila nasuta TaxID=42062 RepID=UPI00295E878D|nr:uncharacterized protein LOC132798023 [Drosophila nasuta]
MSEEMTTEELPTVQAKYEYCYAAYEQCAALLGCRLPPCDTEVFGGDYTRWPTFRDLFTALYIQNPRLSEVEKLFYLNSKTSGEAHAIVSKSPLTNEGFQSAWSSLTERFENKRLLVNKRHRTPEAIAEVSSSTNAPTVPRASPKKAPVSRQVNSFVTIKT